MYEKYFKRPFDILCALAAITVFFPLYAIVAVFIRIKLGSPVLFVQERPGKDEKIFKLYKFRTMTDARDENGELLPDHMRLTKFGRMLRAISIDELPEAFNILRGDMSVVGPRPQLVRDMLFMTEEQRARYKVLPGLSGLAQVSGRNHVSWERKLEYDLQYIQNISFLNDLKIIFKTVYKAFIKPEGVAQEGLVTAEDYGDYLLRENAVSQEEYDIRIRKSKELLGVK